MFLQAWLESDPRAIEQVDIETSGVKNKKIVRRLQPENMCSETSNLISLRILSHKYAHGRGIS